MPEVKIIMKVSMAPALSMQNDLGGRFEVGHVDDADTGEVEPVDQLGVLVVDQQQLAVGTADVGQERGPAWWC